MTKERGIFKSNIKNILFNDQDVCNILDVKTTDNKIKKFNTKVKSHLFINDTLEERDSFIFFDIIAPKIEKNLKDLKIVIYAICHRDILDDFSLEGFYGNRADILGQAVEKALLSAENSNEFGIGEIQLQSVDIYNSRDYYGVQLIFDTSCFN